MINDVLFPQPYNETILRLLVVSSQKQSLLSPCYQGNVHEQEVNQEACLGDEKWDLLQEGYQVGGDGIGLVLGNVKMPGKMQMVKLGTSKYLSQLFDQPKEGVWLLQVIDLLKEHLVGGGLTYPTRTLLALQILGNRC